MSVLLNSLWLLSNMLIVNIQCTADLTELTYRGIFLTWRRLLSPKSDLIDIEIIITLAITDIPFHLCDSHHSKQHQIQSSLTIECIDSWDHCLSWPSHTLDIECHSTSHDYPKSVSFYQINLSLPPSSNSNPVFYQFRYPPSNSSCCWYSLDSPGNSVELISYLNVIERTKINSPPLARFPEHIFVHLNKEDFIYSFQVFDPEGDLFHCSSLSSVSAIIIDQNCILTIKANTQITEDEILIKMEIIEYLNHKTDHIRSRLPYHFLALIDHDNNVDKCQNLPLIQSLNIENNLIHVRFNEPVHIHFISQSQCQIEMDQCFVISAFHWKTKSIIETSLRDHQSQIQLEFEWIPKTSQQCGYHIHCIRCLDQWENFNDKCINIFVNGNQCQNVTHVDKSCSWSPYSMWTKNNQTTYKRTRTCRETSNPKNPCSFCYGSSIQLQSSSVFTKDIELFEQSLLSPTRAHSTMKIIFLVTIIWSIAFLLALVISFYYGIKKVLQQKKKTF